MKNSFTFLVTLVTILFATSCSNNEMIPASQDAQMPATRSVGVKTPKLTTYIETNDINPLNMGEYYFTGTNPQEQVVDHVILFASNIRGTATTVELYHNDNQSHILANVNTLVRPLQAKGIKVLLGLLGDHTGIGFANLSSDQITSFANQVADCVDTYGLDGVDFDDEYAEYGRITTSTSPSGANFSLLIDALRGNAKMSGKLITAFYYGYATSFNQTALNDIDYMWPDFGVSPNAPSGFANSKWAKLSIQYTQGYPGASDIMNAAISYSGYGAIMMFNLRDDNASGMMNYFAPYVWGGKTVSRTNNYYTKNY